VYSFIYICTSIKHQFDGKWNDANTRLSTCDPHDSKFVINSETPQEVEVGKDIIFTYDVRFEVLVSFWLLHDSFLTLNVSLC
jgi:hypothetical protein